MPRHDHPTVVFGWYGLAGTAFFVAAAEAIAADVVPAPVTDDTRNALAELAGRHGWQLDPDIETGG